MRLVLLASAVSAGVASGSADTAGEALVFPVTLADGGLVLSLGDPARVGDTLVLSVPLVVDGAGGWSQLVTIPLAMVDWPLTQRHAEAVRAARYAATLGPEEYSRLTAEVAHALQTLVAAEDQTAASRIAIDARRRVFDWSVAHHGYRQHELQEIVAMLDARLARLEPGQAGPVRVTLLPSPPPPAPNIDLGDPVAMATQALAAARLTPVPTERVGLLQGVLGLIVARADDLPGGWKRETEDQVTAWLQSETELDRAYGEMIAMLLARAHLAARDADPATVAEVATDLEAGNADLGTRRPGMVAAAAATIEQIREDAVALAEERREWAARTPHHEAAGERLAQTLDRVGEHRAALEGIKAQTVGGFDAGVLEGRLQTVLGTLDTPRPPAGFEGVHSLLRRALQLAAGAARLRRESETTDAIRDAASAAAGALMLLDQTEANLGRLLSYPQLP